MSPAIARENSRCRATSDRRCCLSERYASGVGSRSSRYEVALAAKMAPDALAAEQLDVRREAATRCEVGSFDATRIDCEIQAQCEGEVHFGFALGSCGVARCSAQNRMKVAAQSTRANRPVRHARARRGSVGRNDAVRARHLASDCRRRSIRASNSVPASLW